MTEILLPNPGLVSNAADNRSCYLATMQMVMRTKPEGAVYSFEEMDRIQRRKPGFYSWEYALLENLAQNGFEVKTIGSFSTKRFVAEKEDYLIEYFGEEAGEVQIRNSQIPIILEDAEKFLTCKTITIEERVPSLEDIRQSIKNGWYIIPIVNHRILKALEGYSAHFVLIYGISGRGVRMHNPGPPALEATEVSWELFERAWSSPSPETRSLICIRCSALI